MNTYTVREEKGILVARRKSDNEKLGHALGNTAEDREALTAAINKYGWEEVVNEAE